VDNLHDLLKSFKELVSMLFSDSSSLGGKLGAVVGIIFILFVFGLFSTLIRKSSEESEQLFENKQRELENDPNSLQSLAKSFLEEKKGSDKTLKNKD